jgi:PKD repeat protein
LDTGYNKVRVNPNPVADFTINNDTQCFSTNLVQFTNAGKSKSPVSAALTHSWNLGDTTSSTSASPSRTYQVYGKRTVTLISTNNYGCKDTNIQSLRILKQPEAKISFVKNTLCLTDNKFEIIDGAIIDSKDASFKKQYVVYHKPKNDTFNYSGTNIKFSMPDTGKFKVKSFVTTALGCIDSSLNYINVMSMPIAKIEYDKIGKCEGNFNNFILKRTNYVNSVNDQNFWSVAGTSIGTDTVISYKQNTPGKYIVKLKLVSE